MEHRNACKHLRLHPELEILWTLDAYLHATDAYAKCRHCDAHYLVEMIDLKGKDAAFRIARLPSDYVTKTVRSLQKGSCDINRARNEAFALRSLSERLPVLLIMRDGQFAEAVSIEPDIQLPQASWRELPCDGSWLALSNADTD